jgi:branched-chain amino acid transport system ATP-binding protein
MHEPNTPLLEIRGLNAGYGMIPVLRDITFSIGKGDLMAMVGSNGAGKTTLIKTISGLIQPTAGEIILREKSIVGLNSAEIVRMGVTQAPEGRRIFSGLSVEENLRLGAFTRTSKTAKDLEEDLENIYTYFPRLKERRSQLAGTMSGGEQQMCAIGRALMGRPQLLMIDELSLGLAPIIVESLLDILTQIHAGGTTILLVEQDASVALGFCQQAVVLETGCITYTGSAVDLLSDGRLVKSYLG